MKEKIIFIILMLALMALLPFVTAKCSNSEINMSNTSATADAAKNSEDNSDKDSNALLCALVAAKYKDDYCDETLKALAIILNTNYKVNPDSFKLDDKSICLYEKDANNSVKDAYPKIKECAKSVKEKTLWIESKAFFIPFSLSSNGHTYESPDYDYIFSVASPWDCYQKDYSENTECIGVSISGVNYLCKKGSSYEEALKWYLPQFEIKS